MKDNKLVNGPVNVFRLEGKIGNIKKVIYLFGDYHFPINQETKCDSFISDDFVSYFIKTMDKTDKNIMYDFFCENFADIDMFEGYKYSDSPYRQKYIGEVKKYVNSDIDMNIKEQQNKKIKIENKGSKTFTNLRLHHLDIRSFFARENINILINEVIYLLNNFEKNFKIQMIDLLIINLSNLKNYIICLSNHLNEFLNNNKSFVDNIKIEDNIIRTEIKKFLDIIKSEEPRMILYLEKMFKKYNYGPDYTKIKKIFYQVILKYEIMYDYHTRIYSQLTDIYLLRRILDKDYVENVIVYSGMSHTKNYIYNLIKEFGFTITNLDYSKLSIKETNEIIPKMELNELSELLNKPKFKQCVDMNKFPEKFL
jgi:hypothetical protein